MAPVRGSPSTGLPRKSILKDATRPRNVKPEPLFLSSKKDKRKIRHEQLISKIAKSAHPKSRRRRPNKKLVATLDALADALPQAESQIPSHAAGTAGHQLQSQVNLIQRKSMKSKPGAMKRREKVDKGERDRFAKNLAQLAGSNTYAPETPGSESQSSSTGDRWKALRSFIGQTMEKKPELIT